MSLCDRLERCKYKTRVRKGPRLDYEAGIIGKDTGCETLAYSNPESFGLKHQ